MDELRAIAAANPALQVRFLLTRDRAAAGDETAGRLDAVQLAPWLDANAHVLACGPAGFVETAAALIATRAASFAAESFSPPVFENTDTGTVELTLARSGRTRYTAHVFGPIIAIGFLLLGLRALFNS